VHPSAIASLHQLSACKTIPQIAMEPDLRISKYQSVLVKVIGLWLLASTAFITVVTRQNPRVRASVGMGWGLILIWIVLLGYLMYRFREPIRVAVSGIRLDWRVKFVLFATGLALVEEAITTTMTNLAPLFGVKIGEAYITASTNYLDVIALHSVMIFVPMFVGWAFILWRYDFSPFAVFLLRNYMGGLPKEVFESASIDGASHATSFFRLAIPMSVPVLASLAIFQFLFVWNDLLVSLIYIGPTRSENLPMTVVVSNLVSSLGGETHFLTAAAFLTMILPLVVFLLLQRYFVRGITGGAVKG
jgi:ABC-type glycerol-3-phosphate transport system permease component